MKTLPIYAAAAAALLALAACDNKPEEVDSRAPDPNREKVDAAPKKALPPPVETSVTFRCQPGNTLLYVDFYKGATMVTLRATKEALPVRLDAPEAGQPYVGADGSKVTGTAKAATVVVAGGAPHTCKS